MLEDLGYGIGTIVCGGGRSGKWEVRVAPVGEKERPNSKARVAREVLVGEEMKRRLILDSSI